MWQVKVLSELNNEEEIAWVRQMRGLRGVMISKAAKKAKTVKEIASKMHVDPQMVLDAIKEVQDGNS